jgi:hypothetical protein
MQPGEALCRMPLRGARTCEQFADCACATRSARSEISTIYAMVQWFEIYKVGKKNGINFIWRMNFSKVYPMINRTGVQNGIFDDGFLSRQAAVLA